MSNQKNVQRYWAVTLDNSVTFRYADGICSIYTKSGDVLWSGFPHRLCECIDDVKKLLVAVASY